MNDFPKVFPWLVVGVAVLFLLFLLMPPGTSAAKMDMQQFGSLPCIERGRLKPLDTVARVSLMIISNKQTYKDENGEMQPAIKWLLDTMAQREKSFNLKVIRIENDQVLAQLGLERRPGSYRYAINEFRDKIERVFDDADTARELKSNERDLYQQKILELAERVKLYFSLANLRSPLLVPPADKQGDWQSLPVAYAEMKQTGDDNPYVRDMATVLDAYSGGDAHKFNDTLREYHKRMASQFPGESKRTDFELFFNHFEPFMQCMILYGVVLLLAVLSWFGWTEPLGRAAFSLAVMTLVVHTAALIARMYLMDRWFVFVTNLYSTAIFIGWASVILGLVLEYLYRNGMGTVVAALLGLLTMFIAHHLGSSGDTLEMLQAVLDTNFWLATHVTCMNLGYAATFVVGVLGSIYIVRGVLTPSLDKTTAKTLTTMLYAILCFATLVSFTGTVLGGIWADQSWGRFWGWDPKENGAVLIVIWNALILHARWGGMVQARGMALLSVVGSMITGWSWFGTNQLQVGLHTYGFSNTLAVGLVISWGYFLVILVMGLLPMRWWVSYQRLQMPAPIAREETPKPSAQLPGKRRGKRAKRGDAGYFPGPA